MTQEGQAEESKEQAAPEQAAPPVAQPAPKAKAAPEPPAKTPPAPGGVADLLKEALPGVPLEAYQGLSHVIVEVARDDIAKVMAVAKDDPRLDLKFLRCLFGVDHEADGLEVIYQLMSLDKGHEVTIKTRLAANDAKVASVASIWHAADWHERETRDMFGIEFEAHPHLLPLLLPEDMTDYFPLRKSSKLAEIEEWQGELVAEGTGGDGEEEEE
ncbi:MAG: NADH-quinone oxidoreductase subunit C [Dehalococcoidia bacterium]